MVLDAGEAADRLRGSIEASFARRIDQERCQVAIVNGEIHSRDSIPGVRGFYASPLAESSSRVRLKIASSIASVSTPVCVFCRLG